MYVLKGVSAFTRSFLAKNMIALKPQELRLANIKVCWSAPSTCVRRRSSLTFCFQPSQRPSLAIHFCLVRATTPSAVVIGAWSRWSVPLKTTFVAALPLALVVIVMTAVGDGDRMDDRKRSAKSDAGPWCPGERVLERIQPLKIECTVVALCAIKGYSRVFV